MSAPAVQRPREVESVDVVLRDGSTLHVRPVGSADRSAIREFLKGLSPQSIGFRFFGGVDLEWAANWSVDVDYADRYALVATTGSEQSIVAHAAYIRTGPQRAEVAFMVSDDWQGHGIATIMLAHLAAAAERHGITLMTAEVLPHNHRMIEVFRDSGFTVKQRFRGDVIEIELPSTLSPEVLERFEEREGTAAVAAVSRFLKPRTVAVIGASRRRHTVGGELLHNLIRDGFTGEVYAVNKRARTVQGQRAYASIGDVPQRVDLAVVVVPAADVVNVARACGGAGVRALLVISAGFAEVGGAGARRQARLMAVCRQSGMRLIGPNCLGVFNTAPLVRLNATFSESAPVAGRVSFLSQSGGLGIAIIEAAARLGLGLSSFVSVGNKADISGNDLLEYWEHDPDTDVLLLYLESFGNPRRFARIARRVGASKPIVAVKSGRSPAGARATSSHTGALMTASDVTVDALFEQAGVIRTDTMQEMFDVASLLAAQPVPRGERVAIVTNAGGPGIMCADACQAGGLQVVELPARVRRRLAAFLAAEASLGNPVDMIATASAADYRRAIEILARADVCDAIITIFVRPLATRAADVAREIREASLTAGPIPVAAVFMSGASMPRELESPTGHIPAFSFPEDAARALAHAARYGRWRARPAGSVAQLTGLRARRAGEILAAAVQGGGRWLAPEEVSELMGCYGLPIIQTRVVANATRAVAAAREIGGPVALKALARGLVHKTEAGGVRLSLSGVESVRAAAREIEAAVSASGHRLEGFVVQPMTQAGVELLIGVVHDESFGPVIACAAGGTSVELVRDVAVRITPLTDLDAGEMLRRLRTFPLLQGYRGAPACDISAVEDVLLRISALVDAHPEIAELDANPVVAQIDGAVIVDARIRVSPVSPTPPRPSL